MLVIFSIFSCGAHFKGEMAEDRPRQCANKNC